MLAAPMLLIAGWTALFAPQSLAASAPPFPAPPPARSGQFSPEFLGDLAMIRQQYMAAIEDYRQAPASPVIWNKLGMAWHHLFAMDEARRDYERALRLRPDFPEALNNLGAVYYAEKSYKKAVRLYRKAAALDPSSASIYSNLGTAYFAEEKFDLGLAAYQKAFALDPAVFNDSAFFVSEPLPPGERAQQDFCIARIFAQSGNTAQALEYLRRALNEGFDDRRRLFADKTLASLRATPDFAHLMAGRKLQ